MKIFLAVLLSLSISSAFGYNTIVEIPQGAIEPGCKANPCFIPQIIIVQKGNTLVFVEVKSASSAKFGHPAERVDKKKINNLIRAAQQYLIENNIEGCDLRFDVVTLVKGEMAH